MQTAWEDYAYREDIIEIAQRAVYPPRTPAWAKLPMGVAPQSPAERREQRERLRKQAAESRVQAKQEACDEKRRSLEGPLIELPALVLRDGTVVHLPLEHVPAILRPYLPALCVDVENTGYQLGHVHYALRTVQLGGEHHAVVFDADDPVQMAVAGWAMRSAEILHAFSASADLVPCVNAKIISWEEAWFKMRDGVNYAKLTDPAMTGSDAEGLKELSHDVLGDYAVSKAADEARAKLFLFNKTLTKTTVLTPYERSGWANVNKNSTTMIRYAGSDVLDLAATIRVLAAKLPVPEEVLVRECDVQAMTSRVAYEGAELDLPHIKLKITEHEGRQAVARAVVQHMSGGAITNPSSAPEVLPALQSLGYELKPDRKTKQPSAGKGSLEPYAAKGDVLAKYILEYRHCTTTLGLLLRPLENLCEQGDGRMRPTVYTLEARTGRMSTVRPNSQQFSRQGGIRACVRAPEGYRGISADFSGCEILVAAALSGDKQLYEAETSTECRACKEDPCACGLNHTGLHWLTAHTAKGSSATKEDRYNAKRGTFTRLFGGGPATAADQVGTEVRVMEELFDAFNLVAPAYTAWDQWLRECFDQGSMAWRDYSTGENYAVPVEGSRRLVYRCYSGRNVYVTRGPHAAGNGAIQGTARELLVDGLLRWRETAWGNCVVIPIHDEVVGFVREDEAEAAVLELQRCMATRVLSSPGFEVFVDAEPDKPWRSWPDSS